MALGFQVLSFVHGDAAEQKQSASDAKQMARGSIEGLVTFRGEIPKSAVADDAGVRRDLLQVDRASGGLQGVVVWLVMAKTPAEASGPQAGRSSDAETVTAVMDQRDHEFVPRVLAIRSGQSVKFINSDPANHNVRTSSSQPTNEFNVFTGIDGSYTHRFAADPQQRPIRLGCDIHPWMQGWIYVFDHPYFAVTDKQGAFRIDSVPPGEYRLMIKQPDIRYAHERRVPVSNAQSTKVEIEIRAEDLPKPKE